MMITTCLMGCCDEATGGAGGAEFADEPPHADSSAASRSENRRERKVLILAISLLRELGRDVTIERSRCLPEQVGDAKQTIARDRDALPRNGLVAVH